MKYLIATIILGLLLVPALALTAFSTQEIPQIAITIDSTKPYPGDSIRSTPSISITVTTSNSVSSGNIVVDSRAAAALTFTQSGNKFLSTYEVTTALPDGSRGLTIEVTDNYNNIGTFEIFPLYVDTAGSATIQGFPLNYPNPFDPGSQTTNIGYTLSKPANITVNIFNQVGNLVVKVSASANQDGGRAGYNEITWDGRATSGDYVGNGIYIYLITANGSLVTNGKGKLTVFKQ